jgi:RNA polymerase sigma factor (sigma-70 family)
VHCVLSAVNSQPGVLPCRDFSVRFRMARMAKNTMISSNTRLVISIVKKYAANANAPMADLIAEGMNGLMRGVERFDPSKGFKFSTYAHWWVRQAITRSISDQSKIIR